MEEIKKITEDSQQTQNLTMIVIEIFSIYLSKSKFLHLILG